MKHDLSEHSRRGVSNVVGIGLLIGITVALAAVLAIYGTGMAGELTNPSGTAVVDVTDTEREPIVEIIAEDTEKVIIDYGDGEKVVTEIGEYTVPPSTSSIKIYAASGDSKTLLKKVSVTPSYNLNWETERFNAQAVSSQYPEKTTHSAERVVIDVSGKNARVLGGLLIQEKNSQLVMTDLTKQDRPTVWTSTVEPGQWYGSDGVLYFASQTGVRAVNPLQNTVIWSTTEYGGETGSSMPRVLGVHQDTVYVSDKDGGVVALDKHTGDVKWRNSDATEAVSPISAHDGLIYLTTDTWFSDPVYAINAETGETQWTRNLPLRYGGEPLSVWKNEIVVTTDSYRTYINAKTGETKNKIGGYGKTYVLDSNDKYGFILTSWGGDLIRFGSKVGIDHYDENDKIVALTDKTMYLRVNGDQVVALKSYTWNPPSVGKTFEVRWSETYSSNVQNVFPTPNKIYILT